MENTPSEIEAKCSEIKLKINLKSYTRKKIDNKKAECYKVWYAIYKEKEEKIEDFYSCIECDQVVHVNVTKIGTNQLSRHGCLEKSDQQSKLLSFFKKNKLKDFSKELTAASCSFVVKDMRPAIEGNGLAELLSLATKIGATNGFMQPDEVKKMLPDSTTVNKHFILLNKLFFSILKVKIIYSLAIQINRNIHKAASTVRTDFASQVTNVYKQHGGAIAIDLWTNKSNKIDFFGCTLH